MSSLLDETADDAPVKDVAARQQPRLPAVARGELLHKYTSS